MRKLCVLALLVNMMVTLPASAQLYHEQSGGGRVIKQGFMTGGALGLGGEASRATYIGSGTLSLSAQNKNAGMNTGGLPSVSMGGTIRTPGDNLYNGPNTIRMENGAVNYKDNLMREYEMKRRMDEQRRFEQFLRQRQNPYAQQGNFYVPGSNGGVATYGSSGGSRYNYNNGVASYGSYGR